MTDRERTIQGMLIQKIQTCEGQKDAAAIYAYAMSAGPLRAGPDFWKPINEATTARWPKGLARVKREAWKMYEAFGEAMRRDAEIEERN